MSALPIKLPFIQLSVYLKVTLRENVDPPLIVFRGPRHIPNASLQILLAKKEQKS